MSHCVALPGLTANVKAWWEQAVLHAMSSRLEGLPNTLAEVMAHGVPAVSFDCDTGTRGVIRHDGTACRFR